MIPTLHRKFLSTLGLAVRARKTVCGTQNVCDALKAGKAAVVIVASDNSENTAKRLSDRCLYYKIRLIESGATSAELGAAAGKSGGTAAVAVTDANLAHAVTEAYEKYAAQNSGNQT